MVAVAHEGNTKLYWLTACADITVPSVAEMAAGTLITGVVGYNFPSGEAAIDTSDVDSQFNTSVVGRTQAGPITLTIKRDDTTETGGFDLFATPKTTGFLVRAYFGDGLTNGDQVAVFPAQYGVRQLDSYSENSVQTFEITIHVTSAPEYDATVTT